ncbi:branched-chain amino acid ABC transporter permease [Phytoactinopolyspora endophytica]|uniref:branched-chain amino acid ABC transporter permease n=1 Tax=Phytoactinopolyspora endophytica TaxID=1642495 RepID=UPI00101B89A5|nr:branched-chain amino acid ABC transporter permease [Phytoactinopolyspora endophytica]
MFDSNIANPAYLLQLFLSGMSMGSLFALFALAFVIVWKASSHLNLAAGELGALGVFTMSSLVLRGMAFWLALAVVLVVALGVGALMERSLIRPAEKRGLFAVVLTTLAVYLVANAAIGLAWGTEPATAPSPFDGGAGSQLVLMDGPPQAYLTYGDLLSLAALAVVGLALSLFLQRTRYGLAYRAVASNRESAGLVGIPLPRMFIVGWGLSVLIATLTAVLVGVRNGAIDYAMMTPMLVFGLTAATVGGFESLKGAVVGGLALGLAVNLFPGLLTFVSGDLGLVVALVLVLVVLLLRPQGLFGVKRLERV